jgi:cation diffusion facilitator family transporter
MAQSRESVKITKLHQGQKVARLDTVITIVLAGVKAFFGILSGSIALTTDAIHTASDSITRFASWFGLRIAQRRADEKFQFGYFKAETITTLFISIVILYAGYEVLTESYSKLFSFSKLSIPYWVSSIPLIAIVYYYFIAKLEEKTGRTIDSQSLIALAQDSKLNIFISLTVFIGIISTLLKIPYIEGAVGIGISLLIFKVGIENGKNAILSLMDANPSATIEKQIKKIITSNREVKRFEGLRLRRAGPFIFGEVNIEVAKTLDVGKAHDISEQIEETIKAQIPQIESFTTHIEPYKPELQTIIIPIDTKEGINSRISPHFGRSKYLIFIEVEKNKIISYTIKNNPYRKGKVGIGLLQIHKTIKEKIDALITQQIGVISYHHLEDHLVEIYQTNEERVDSALEQFLQKKLKRLKRPTKTIGVGRADITE